jgi:hypothetical protein
VLRSVQRVESRTEQDLAAGPGRQSQVNAGRTHTYVHQKQYSCIDRPFLTWLHHVLYIVTGWVFPNTFAIGSAHNVACSARVPMT